MARGSTVYIFGVILIINVFFLLYLYLNNPKTYLKNNLGLLSNLSENRETVIYLVKNVNTCCRPFLRIDEFISHNAGIFVFVDSDFSDQDIANLKDAFHFPNDCLVTRMRQRISAIYKKCNRKRTKQPWNYMAVFTDVGNLLDFQRF